MESGRRFFGDLRVSGGNRELQVVLLAHPGCQRLAAEKLLHNR